MSTKRRAATRKAATDAERHVHGGQLLENMASMRRVTANPPKMLMQASRTATNEITVISGVALADLQQGADDDDPGDRIGHRHEWGVQRVVHVPDHVVADHDRQREHSQVRWSCAGASADQQEQDRSRGRDHAEPLARRHRLLRFRGRDSCRGRAPGCGRDLHGRRRPGRLAVPHDGDAALHDVVEVQDELAVLAGREQLEQVDDVGAVQL